MRTAVTAFVLGATAVAAVAFGLAFVLVVLAEASGREALRVGVADVEFLMFERRPDGSETAFGPAFVLLPLLGGLANAGAAAVIGLRRRGAA